VYIQWPSLEILIYIYIINDFSERVYGTTFESRIHSMEIVQLSSCPYIDTTSRLKQQGLASSMWMHALIMRYEQKILALILILYDRRDAVALQA